MSSSEQRERRGGNENRRRRSEIPKLDTSTQTEPFLIFGKIDKYNLDYDPLLERLGRSVSKILGFKDDSTTPTSESSESSDDSSSSSHQGPKEIGIQTYDDPLALETERLAFDVIFFVLGRSKSGSVDQVTATLRRSVSKMLDKYNYFFSGLITRLQVRPGMDFKTGFFIVASELFLNNEDITWSKIIALFAFGARLASHCCNDEKVEWRKEHGEKMVVDVATNLADFAVQRLTSFIQQHGGWVSICEAFPAEEDYEAKIWRSLLVTGLGLGALATFLAIQH